MVALKSILVLLPCFLYAPTLAIPAFVPDALTLSPTTLGGSNFTQGLTVEKRMDRQPSVPAQSSAQNTNAFEEAKRRGAKYLELLTAKDEERNEMALYTGEPFKEATFNPRAADSRQLRLWRYFESPETIPTIVQGNEALLKATCPTTDYQPDSRSLEPLSMEMLYSLEPNAPGGVIISIYDVVSGGFMRMTNAQSPRWRARNVKPFAPAREGPMRDSNDWERLECSGIATQWMLKTERTQNIRTMFREWPNREKPLFESSQPSPPAPERSRRPDQWKRVMEARKGLRTVSDPSIRNAQTEPILLAVYNDEANAQNGRFSFPEDLKEAVTLPHWSPNAWAILGAPGNRWLFELLYNWRTELGHKIPESVRLYKTANDHVGMTVTLVDFTDLIRQSIRTKTNEHYPDSSVFLGPGSSGPPGAGGSTSQQGQKRPGPDNGGDGPAGKRPQTGYTGKGKGRATG